MIRIQCTLGDVPDNGVVQFSPRGFLSRVSREAFRKKVPMQGHRWVHPMVEGQDSFVAEDTRGCTWYADDREALAYLNRSWGPVRELPVRGSEPWHTNAAIREDGEPRTEFRARVVDLEGSLPVVWKQRAWGLSWRDAVRAAQSWAEPKWLAPDRYVIEIETREVKDDGQSLQGE